MILNCLFLCIIKTMENNNSLKYTCLFGGGAIRGAAYVGTMRAMEELGINPTTLAGSSVGSVIAGLMAVGYSAEEAYDVFMQFNFEIFRDVQLSLGPKFALSKGELFLEWIRDLIEKKYYGDKYKKGTHKAVTFKDIENDLVIITTDLSSFECKEFSKYETPDYEIASAIRISCGMPGLMRPVEYNNRILVDGDLQKSWPMWKLSKHLLPQDERVLEFRLEGDFEGNDKNTIEYVNSLYAFTTSMATTFIIDIYGKNDKFDYIVINTGDINIVDFNMPEEKRRDLMEKGYAQTIEYFKKVLPDKKQKLHCMYSNLYEKLKKVSKNIKKQNITNAKNQICEVFVDLCEYKDFIDNQYYEYIRGFKNILLDNISYPALFGKTTLRNTDEVEKYLDKILAALENKIKEIETFLSCKKTKDDIDNEKLLT